MEIQHKELAQGRWAKMSLSEQMANIGSEISRAIHWKKKNNEKYSHNSVNRALELISLSIDTVSMKSHIKELTRLREAIKDYFYGDNEFSSTDISWQTYFDHFNYAARLKQNKV